ncbi:MAG: DUF1064 domain-containing protein [Bacteroidales bacterium]|nr:DUF1064 domain-containing protein [Bacteroidales bacterium]
MVNFNYNKYHNKKAEYGGRVFDSKIERARYIFLLSEQQKGEISDLQCQVKFNLFPTWYKKGKNSKGKIVDRVYKRETNYIADFVYMKDGVQVVEDVKGMETKEFKLKESMMHWLKGIDIKKVKKATEKIGYEEEQS